MLRRQHTQLLGKPPNYFLCFECEQGFREKGEDWVLAHSYRGSGTFRFREILHGHEPTFKGPEGSIYSTSLIPELNMDAVIYFAMSVFWRAGAHRWRRDQMIINFDLGKYEEPLRLFLRGQASFPDHMVLRLWISSLKDNLCAVVHLPEEGRKGNVRSYQCAVPGMTFELMVGAHIGKEYYRYSTCPAPERLVGIIHNVDAQDVLELSRRWNAVRSCKQ